MSKSRAAVVWIESNSDSVPKDLRALLVDKANVEFVSESLFALPTTKADALLSIHAPKRSLTPSSSLWLAAGRSLAAAVPLRTNAAAKSNESNATDDDDDDDEYLLLAITCLKRAGSAAATLESLVTARRLVRLATRNDQRAPPELCNAQVT